MLKLLHDAGGLVAIDKPCGLLVHRSALDAQADTSAVDQLQAQLGARLAPLHRLDKATSGVLLFARDEEVAREWGEAFRAGAVRKRYLALVRGWPEAEGVIDAPLARDPELPSAGQPRLEAVTRFRRIACLEWPLRTHPAHPGTRCAVVEVEPLTGRRHQIRRHFKHIAHPLIGDSTHGKGPLNRALAQWLGISRLWLHAVEIERGPLRIEAAPGPEWAQLLA